MWGIRKVYQMGFGVQASKPDDIPEGIRRKMHSKTARLVRRIRKNAGKRGCNGRAKKWFYLMRFAHRHFPPMQPDHSYWETQNWHGSGRPWRQN